MSIFEDRQILIMHLTDHHTLHELQILPGNTRMPCILNFFDRTKTPGGRDFLKQLISKPKENLQDLLSFQDLLKTITVNVGLWEAKIHKSYLAAAVEYQSMNVAHTMSQDVFQHWFDTMIYSWKNPAEFYRIQSGLIATLRFLRAMQEVMLSLADTDIPSEVASDIDFAKNFFSHSTVKSFLKSNEKSISIASVFRLDYYFRVKRKDDLEQLIHVFHKFDAYISIVKTAKSHNLIFPEFDLHHVGFEAQGLWHPLIPNAVPNSFLSGDQRPVCILTGANTSGKTTFLKTCGVALHLSHLGWPVPASRLCLPFYDRLFTSIHLSDDLSAGYSHFYNEMMRIKGIAEALSKGEKCFVIIDELFRGTNQEDAKHCSQTVLNGFLKNPDSFFFVSTHLHELIDIYRDSDRVMFCCFKTKILEHDFENTFRIESGIAIERVGTLIMEKTGVTELLEQKKSFT
jgi:DNA mismatch repair protein MutS